MSRAHHPSPADRDGRIEADRRVLAGRQEAVTPDNPTDSSSGQAIAARPTDVMSWSSGRSHATCVRARASTVGLQRIDCPSADNRRPNVTASRHLPAARRRIGRSLRCGAGNSTAFRPPVVAEPIRHADAHAQTDAERVTAADRDAARRDRSHARRQPSATPMPPAIPTPSASPVPTIEGVWASEPITHQMIRDDRQQSWRVGRDDRAPRRRPCFRRLHRL